MAVAEPDSLGLAQLHRPDEAMVDICFVHGVNGGNISTWTMKDKCWPRDLLPSDIPNARILSYGYDAKIVGFWTKAKVSHNSVEMHAANLIGALVGDRSKSESAVRNNIPIFSIIER